MHKPTYVADPCPECGKPDAARMGSTDWGHDYMCCSDKCGRAFVMSPKRRARDLEKAELELAAAQHKVRELRRRR